MKWKDIPGAPGYEASASGDIRNKKTGQVLKPFSDTYQDANQPKIIYIYED